MPTLIPQASGSTIGNMLGFGGLAAAFDGSRNQVSTSCCSKAPSSAGYNNTVGKDWGLGNSFTVTQITLYAANDVPLMGISGTNIMLQGSPDGLTWTTLYTSGTVLTAASQVVIIGAGIDMSTAYRYHQIVVNGNGVNGVYLAEVEFYQSTAYTLTPSAGSFAETGVAALMARGTAHTLSADAGSFAETGNAITMLHGLYHAFVPAAGAFTVIGQPNIIAINRYADTHSFRSEFVLQQLRRVAPQLTSGMILVSSQPREADLLLSDGVSFLETFDTVTRIKLG